MSPLKVWPYCKNILFIRHQHYCLKHTQSRESYFQLCLCWFGLVGGFMLRLFMSLCQLMGYWLSINRHTHTSIPTFWLPNKLHSITPACRGPWHCDIQSIKRWRRSLCCVTTSFQKVKGLSSGRTTTKDTKKGSASHSVLNCTEWWPQQEGRSGYHLPLMPLISPVFPL